MSSIYTVQYLHIYKHYPHLFAITYILSYSLFIHMPHIHMSHIGKKSDLFTRLLQYDINEERLARLKTERGEPLVSDPSAVIPSTDTTTTATDVAPTDDQSFEAAPPVDGIAPAKKTRAKKPKAPKAPKPVILGPLEQHDHILKHGYGYTDDEIAQMHIEDTARITEILVNAGKVKSQREISIKTLAISPVEDFTPAGQCILLYSYALLEVCCMRLCILLLVMHLYHLLYVYAYRHASGQRIGAAEAGWQEPLRRWLVAFIYVRKVTTLLCPYIQLTCDLMLVL